MNVHWSHYWRRLGAFYLSGRVFSGGHKYIVEVEARRKAQIVEITKRAKRLRVVRAAQEALRAARIAAERARDIAAATMANEMMTLPARHREARDKVLRVSKQAVEGIQKTAERLTTTIRDTEARLAGPPAPATALQQMQVAEVRAALAAMSREQRRLTVLKNLANPLVAGAALRGPAFLAGLTIEEQAEFAIGWAKANHDDELRRVACLRRVLEHVERGGKLLIGYTAGLTDGELIANAEKLEQAAQEAEAGAALH